MIAVILLVLVYAVLASCILCTVFGGRKLGLYGVLLRIGVVSLSCVLAFVIVKLMSPLLLSAEITLLSTLGLPSDLVSALSSGEGGRALVGVLAGGILSPILFTLIAVLLTVIGAIVLHFAARKLPKGSTGVGMGVGALYGLLLALVILFPILSIEGLLNSAVKQSPTLKEGLTDSLGEETVESLDTAASANVAHLLLGNNVVKWTVQGMTDTSFEGGSVDVYDAVSDICEVVEASQVMSDEEKFDFLEMSPEQRLHMVEVLDAINDSPLLSSVFADIVSAWAGAWAEGEAFMGMTSPAEGIDATFVPVYQQMFKSLASSNRESVIPNLETTLDVVSKWTTADEQNRGTVLKEILGTLGEGSEEMAAVATEIKLTGMKVMMQEEIPALKDEEEYDKAVSNVLGLLDEEAPTVENVSAGLNELLTGYEYELSEENLTTAAESLVEKRNELGRPLTEEELADMYIEQIGSTEQS